MKKTFPFILLFFFISNTNGQQLDSISNHKKLSYKSFILPSALIGSGALLLNSQFNRDNQERSNSLFGSNFHTQVDNITVFMPLLQIYTGELLGFDARHTIKHRTVDVVTANALSYGLVTILKNSVKSTRPDGSDQLSFPSGHTAIAFTNAALLYQEYKDANFWYASSGFVFATATGILRIANNKHFSSDVLAGAGIGLASGILVSYYNPLQKLHFGKKGTAFICPQFGNLIGIGTIIRPNF
ncbi:phosphatase PAP2 family protein [Flavobacterium sp. NG2]|uniref:phosphatase PAP2 family protein n=1 Tax=Flavobacterium sp. NG2 TaxID=3097547 RepID=UPI002A83B3A5|nr:phosphatase PAP2 family protein [Flavobacterium sp. NG2]WPR71841.1 phosphatase PAP2 family protein [Flavobacterium sp. NG2]